MNPLVGASIVSGAAGLIGGGASAAASAKAAKEATEMQINWERERAKNAHQWEVQDLKNAGLNPILSAGGSGATTGGISAPVPDTSGYQKAGESVGSALAAAIDTQRLENEKEQLKATLEEIRANVGLKNSQKNLIDQQKINEMVKQHLISAQTAHEMAKLGLTSAQTAQTQQNIQFDQQRISLELASSRAKLAILHEQRQQAEADKDFARAQAAIEEYKAEWKRYVFWNEQIGKSVQSVMGLGITAATAGKGAQLLSTAPKVGFL